MSNHTVVHRVTTFEEALAFVGKKDMRKIANNTWVARLSKDVCALLLHSTYVIKYHRDGTYVFDTGGYETLITTDRMNAYSPFSFWREKNRLWVTIGGYHDGHPARKFEGETLTVKDGKFVGEQDLFLADRRAELEQAILTYAKHFKEAHENGDVGQPGAGDCWGCSMIPEGHINKTTGRITEKNGRKFEEPMGVGHYIDHMVQDYFVPSLMFKACVEAGYMAGIIIDPAKQIRKFLRNRMKELLKEYCDRYENGQVMYRKGRLVA